MQGLHVQLIIAFDRHEAHAWSSDRFGDGFGINVVVLVRLHVRLHVLWRHQANFVALLAQAAAQKMCEPPQSSMPISRTRRLAVNRSN